jgi:hypothetical protein
MAAIGRLSAGLILVGLVSACADQAEEPADTAAVSSVAPETMWTSPVDNIPPAAITGMLNAARWQMFPAVAERLCKGNAQCAAKTRRTQVRLWAFTGSRGLSYSNAGDTAIMVGKIQNMGGDSTLRYGLAPHRTYAIFIMRGPTGGSRYEIWGVQGASKTMADAGDYVECGHPHLTYPISFAVFTDCDHPPELAGSQPGPSIIWTPTGTGATHDDGPAWFTCTSGCCTAGPE